MNISENKGPVNTPASTQPTLSVVTQGVVVKEDYPPVLRIFVEKAGPSHEFLLSDLSKSGLEPKDVPRWYAVRGEGIGRFTRLLASGEGFTPSDGFAIPYRALHGEPIEDAGQHFVRFRLRAPLKQEKKADGTWRDTGKYLSPKDTMDLTRLRGQIRAGSLRWPRRPGRRVIHRRRGAANAGADGG